jgi:hypothetical protein
MKALFTLFAISMFAISVQAQPSLLGKTKAQVIELMKKNVLMKLSENTSDRLLYIEPDKTAMQCIFRNGFCSDYQAIYPMSFIDTIISAMNEQNIKTSDSTWTAKNYKYKATIKVDQSSDGFYLWFEQL